MKTMLFAGAAAVALTAGLASMARAQQSPLLPAGTVTDDGATPATPRDPFLRPAVAVSDAAPVPTPVARADGLAGLSVEEVAVRGVLQAGERSVGVVQAPDKRHYLVRAGDRLRDGFVEAVSADGVVIVLDPEGAAAGRGRLLRRSFRVRREDR